ncbi:Clp protease ClpP [Bacillus sp. RO2]|uniref:head maturation protease, ClpP-related n=1 Tax=Bacillus sp. RO2 TaxID=2723913 RepID=UPI00145E9875|nr:head maturation protease, ClpP-related [Bacillus sp. RO2]NMH72785.1 Clp protease ClpP [Bacillus sp. RO2]
MTIRIDVKGPIISNDEAWIYEWFEIEATCPKTVTSKLLEANGEDVTVYINSPGGYVDEGSEIYTELKNYSGHVEVQIVGLAASAASVIAMAGDKVKISPTAQIMIHNASMGYRGDHRDMEKAAEILKVTDRAIVNAYVIKSGMSEEELLGKMADETWMGAQKALEYKFVDEIMFMDNAIKLTASSSPNMIPPKVINSLRNGFPNKADPNLVTQDNLKEMLTHFKKDFLEETKMNNEKPNEPKATVTAEKPQIRFIF